MFSAKRADRAVRFFNSLKHTKGEFFGKPFELLPWEDRIVRDVYGTVHPDGRRSVRMVYLEIPKKQGKSEVAAGAGLFHTFADGEMNGEVYGCAADRGQASLVFDVAVDMVDQLPALKRRTHLQISHKRMTDRKTGTFYQVLSAEAYTKHGLNVSACVFDELHAQPNRGLWDVMTFGSGAARRQPIWWVISTAGDDPDRVSVCWEQHEYALRVLSGEVVDPSFYPVIYSYDGEDIYNEANWYKANPSLGTTIQIETLQQAAQKAKNKPADERLFRWLHLNQWITTKLTSWLPLDLFDQTEGDWNELEMVGRECYLGVDLSSTTDLSAICLLFPPQGTQLEWRVLWYCWIPAENMKERIKEDHVPYDLWAKGGYIMASEGDVIDYTKIEERILDLSRIYKILEVDADRALATMLLQRLEKVGLVVVDVPQTFQGLSDAMGQIERLLKWRESANHANEEAADNAEKSDGEGNRIESQADEEHPEADELPIMGNWLSGRMTHERNPVARWCFGNTSIAKNGQGYIKFVKEHKGRSVDRTKRIDLVAAWVTAMARARFYTGSTDLSDAILDEGWGM
jgi:phage terminase large subunit-like protein